jgi:hypothetical protein
LETETFSFTSQQLNSFKQTMVVKGIRGGNRGQQQQQQQQQQQLR